MSNLLNLVTSEVPFRLGEERIVQHFSNVRIFGALVVCLVEFTIAYPVGFHVLGKFRDDTLIY